MNINCAVYTSSPLEKNNIVLPAFIYKKVKKASGSKSLTHQPDEPSKVFLTVSWVKMSELPV